MDPLAVWDIPNTLWTDHWPSDVRMDPAFPTFEGLEWLVDDPDADFLLDVPRA